MHTQVVDDAVDEGASLTHNFGSQSVSVQCNCGIQASQRTRSPCMLRLGWHCLRGAVVSLNRAAQQFTQTQGQKVVTDATSTAGLGGCTCHRCLGAVAGPGGLLTTKMASSS